MKSPKPFADVSNRGLQMPRISSEEFEQLQAAYERERAVQVKARDTLRRVYAISEQERQQGRIVTLDRHEYARLEKAMKAKEDELERVWKIISGMFWGTRRRPKGKKGGVRPPVLKSQWPQLEAGTYRKIPLPESASVLVARGHKGER